MVNIKPEILLVYWVLYINIGRRPIRQSKFSTSSNNKRFGPPIGGALLITDNDIQKNKITSINLSILWLTTTLKHYHFYKINADQ